MNNMSTKSIINSSSKSNVLSLDFGETKIGFAIGNQFTQTTHPLKTIISSKKAERYKAIEELIAEWTPGLIVIGLPLNENGSESRLTLLVKKFSEKIINKFNVPTILVDERYTSVEAESLLIASNGKYKKKNGVIDQVAAQIILESYFERSLNVTS
jgi:putative holliday junction resolvase